MRDILYKMYALQQRFGTDSVLMVVESVLSLTGDAAYVHDGRRVRIPKNATSSSAFVARRTIAP